MLPSGAKEDDYAVSEELNKVIVEESRTRAAAAETTDTAEAGEAAEAAEAGDVVSDTAAAKTEAKIGSISFVSCATGEDAMQTLAGEQEAEEGEVTHLSCVLYYFLSCFYFYFSHFRG